MFEDKLATWATTKVQCTQTQEQVLKDELQCKKDILLIKKAREEALTILLKKEIEERIKLHAEKCKAEMELIAMQKKKILFDK